MSWLWNHGRGAIGDFRAMSEFQHQWLEALALDIEQLYSDAELSTDVERIVEYIRAWRK